MTPLATALAYAELGYLCIPIQPLAKLPLISWRRLIDASPVDQPYDRWFSDSARNIAVLACDLAVFDCDDAHLADLVTQKCGLTPYMCVTPHGGRHLYYRRPPGTTVSNRVRIDGLRLDLRTTGGIVLVPPSKLAVGTYQWLGPSLPMLERLPVANVSWLKKPAPVRSLISDRSLAIRRARAYLAKVDIAVSGKGGHATTMRVAGILPKIPLRDRCRHAPLPGMERPL